MASKYIFLVLVLQLSTLCLAKNESTVINLAADLVTGQTFVPNIYTAAATAIDAKYTKVPAEIRASKVEGVWALDHSNAVAPLITLTSKHIFNSISLKAYSTANLVLSFEDKATGGMTSSEVIPATTGKDWVNHQFDFKRDKTSTAAFTLKAEFVASATALDVILIDSISVIYTDPADSGSTAVTPTLITFAIIAVLKTIM